MSIQVPFLLPKADFSNFVVTLFIAEGHAEVGSVWPVPTWNLRTERQTLGAAGVKLP